MEWVKTKHWKAEKATQTLDAAAGYLSAATGVSASHWLPGGPLDVQTMISVSCQHLAPDTTYLTYLDCPCAQIQLLKKCPLILLRIRKQTLSAA